MAVQFKQSEALSGVSITPLLDVVFQLLLFFMLAAQFKDYEDQELDIILPAASEAQPLVAEPDEMFVDINQHGEYFIRSQKLTLDQVLAELKRLAATNPLGANVAIRSDERAHFRHVVEVINKCHEARVTNYKVTTRPD